MSDSLSKACETLIEIKDQFEENQELVDAVLASDNGEDLLTAIGMAIAYTEKAITLNEIGESHIKATAKELTEIAEEFEDGDE